MCFGMTDLCVIQALKTDSFTRYYLMPKITCLCDMRFQYV